MYFFKKKTKAFGDCHLSVQGQDMTGPDTRHMPLRIGGECLRCSHVAAVHWTDGDTHAHAGWGRALALHTARLATRTTSRRPNRAGAGAGASLLSAKSRKEAKGTAYAARALPALSIQRAVSWEPLSSPRHSSPNFSSCFL